MPLAEVIALSLFVHSHSATTWARARTVMTACFSPTPATNTHTQKALLVIIIVNFSHIHSLLSASRTVHIARKSAQMRANTAKLKMIRVRNFVKYNDCIKNNNL